MGNVVLVTGAAGFIGSHLVENLLASGAMVIGVDNFDSFYDRARKESNIQDALKYSNYIFCEGDIRNEEFLTNLFAENRPDVVVHLAAKAGVRPSIQLPHAYFDVNVNGTICLMEVMRKSGVKKLVQASSSSVYGNNLKIPYSETDPVEHPISPYAASKRSAELVSYTYHHLYGFDVLNLRFFTVYGPRQRPDLAIHKFFASLYAGKSIEMYGDGSTSRDYTFVTDTVSGINAAIDYVQNHAGVYEIVNLGNNSPVMLRDLISGIEAVTGKRFLIDQKEMQPGDVNITYADISKAKRIMNYHPDTRLSEGLLMFKDWFETPR